MQCIRLQFGTNGLSYVVSSKYADKAVNSELELLFTKDIDVLMLSLVDMTEEEFNNLPDYEMSFLETNYEDIIIKEYFYGDEK